MIGRVAFTGGAEGSWRITEIRAIRGASLAPAPRLDVGEDDGAAPDASAWRLRGIVSNLRYATRDEVDGLARRQEPPGRFEATAAVLIPITKSAAWWALAQDERRAVFEEQSGHTRIGMGYLPQIARRLHHARDLGEPLDFLTWFEMAPAHLPLFDHLLAELRATPEWAYVEREVEVRLVRNDD